MENYFEGLFRQMPNPCVIIRPYGGQYLVSEVNEGYLALVGKARTDVMGRDFGASAQALKLLKRIVQSKKIEISVPIQYADSDILPDSLWQQATYMPLLDSAGKVAVIAIYYRDVTDAVKSLESRKKSRREVELDAFHELERKVLALSATPGISMTPLLTQYLAGVERLFPGMYCSIFRVGDGRLKSRIAPSIPESFLPIDMSLPIEEGAGSCGTAAFRKQLVVVADIATDPLWEVAREAALAHDLRACWSYPILDANNALLAVLGMYYREVKAPAAKEVDAIRRVAALLRILLENRKNANLVEETVSTLNQAQQLASFGIWQWDTVTDEMTWSAILYDIFGFSEGEFDNTKDGFLAAIVAEDRCRVAETLEHVRIMGEEAIFEARITRADGMIRHLRCWIKLARGGRYHPRVMGACVDVTAVRVAESDLKEIAWMQSHIIRAPVARILGLVDLIRDHPEAGLTVDELLGEIHRAAQELDGVIRSIVVKAAQK